MFENLGIGSISPLPPLLFFLSLGFANRIGNFVRVRSTPDLLDVRGLRNHQLTLVALIYPIPHALRVVYHPPPATRRSDKLEVSALCIAPRASTYRASECLMSAWAKSGRLFDLPQCGALLTSEISSFGHKAYL